MDVPANVSKDVVTCARCGAEVTVFRFRKEDGWRCERCAPVIVPCKNQGCTYSDYDKKNVKHLDYFCEQRTRCVICKAEVSRDTWSAHNGSEHQDITGSTWRAPRAGWRYRLVSSVAGTAVCEYIFNDRLFNIEVRIPVSSERLREFRCEVKITHPTTGHTLTYTPDVEYDSFCDWRIMVRKEELTWWGEEFDVVVNIDKIN